MPDPQQLRLVGVGASAGGVEALIAFVTGLEPDLQAAVVVVLHQPAGVPTVLPRILAGHSTLPVVHAENGAVLAAGHVYLAVPDQHVTVRGGRLLLSHGPKENGHRPAIDPLLRSVAVAAGPGSVGVVLSGMLDDGAAGLLDVVRHGGTALVQDPDEALYASMPSTALEQVPGALVRTAGELGPTLREVVSRIPLAAARVSSRALYELHMSGWDVAAPSTTEGAAATPPATQDEQAEPEGTGTVPVNGSRPFASGESEPPDVAPGTIDPVELEPPGRAAGLSCPDCAGPLFDLSDGGLIRFRCRVGHAWSLESLRAEQGRAVEVALYTALRALEDKASLQRRVADTADAQGAPEVARRARLTAWEALQSARAVRGLVTGAGE